MIGFPGHGYGSCEMCSRLFVKADGTLTCSCMIGYSVSLGNIHSDNVGEFVRGPIISFIRESFSAGLEPFERCSQCLVRNQPPFDPADRNKIGLHIEPSNWCNLYCEACLCTEDRNSSKPAPRCHLDVDAYERMLADLKAERINVNMIALVGFGEPLFHPRIADLVRIGRMAFPDAYIYIDTNGNFGNKKALEIADCGLDMINVAIDGVDQRSYEAYRKGGNFEKVMTFTRHLADAVRQANSRTKVVWKYILFRWNDSDGHILTARQMAKQLGIDIQFHLTVGPNASHRRSDEIDALTGRPSTSFYLDRSFLDNDVVPPINLRNESAWTDEEVCNPYFRLPSGKIDSFCFLAFLHLQITPSGTVKMCCIAEEEVQKNGRPMSVYSHKLDEIWNSEYMLEARKSMAEGRQVKACMRCYREEAALGESRRTSMNAAWSLKTKMSREEILEKAALRGFSLDGHPIFYQLNMGNLCNLACRMCNGDYSSRLAADTVLSAWNPAASLDIPKWQAGWLRLAPLPYVGVDVSGFYDFEFDGTKGAVRWSDGNGEISMAMPRSMMLDRLQARFCAPDGVELMLRVTFNGFEVFFGNVTDHPLDMDVDISFGNGSSKFRLCFISSTVGFADDDRDFGIGLLDLRVSCVKNSGSEALSLTRFDTAGGWWTQKSFMFDELMARPSSLRYLILQGGEPLLNKEFENIQDHLVEIGAAQDVTLEIITNFTLLSDRVLENLSRFNSVELEASVDGIGPVYEYIRYPSRWKTIDENVQLAQKVPNIRLSFVVAVQAYNLLDMAEVLDYCDRHSLSCSMHFLVGPIYLNVLVLPLHIRSLAIERIRASRERAKNDNIILLADYLISYLERKADMQYCDQIDDFMRFTNDLDVSRGQSFAALYPEIVAAFNDLGFPWNPALRYAKASH